MIDEHELFERAAERLYPPADAFDRFTRHQRRRERNRRVVAAGVALAIVIAIGGVFAKVAISSAPVQPENTQPNPFSALGGWIAIGGPTIQAIDPFNPQDRAVLSIEPGDAYVWSNDGRALAIDRPVNSTPDLFVLTSPGTEALVAQNTESAAFTPDGSSIVYGGVSDHSVYRVGIDGGVPTTIASGTNNAGYDFPLLSPDGSVIAYSALSNGIDQGLWTMASDGTGQHRIVTLDQLRSLAPDLPANPRLYSMAWSGNRLAFGATGQSGIADIVFTVRSDGSDLRRLTPADKRVWWSAAWSPSGTEIALVTGDGDLVTMNADGTGERTLMRNVPGNFIAWNPVGAEPGPASQTPGVVGPRHPLGRAPAWT